MDGRVERGLELLRESWTLLREDKQLLLFPILSFAASAVVLASFLLPMAFHPGALGQALGGHAAHRPDRHVYLVLFAMYLASYSIAVFFNVGLASCALIRFRGGRPTLRDGLGAAWASLPQILAWALVAATVGVVLRTVEERVRLVGRIVIGLVGLAWSAVTLLVVPILAAEHLGPFAAARRSAELLRRSWGENLTGQISLGAIGFVLGLPGVALVVAGMYGVVVAHDTLLAGLALGAGVLYLTSLSIVTGTLRELLITAAYVYAAEGTVPRGFSDHLLRDAFRAAP